MAAWPDSISFIDRKNNYGFSHTIQEHTKSVIDDIFAHFRETVSISSLGSGTFGTVFSVHVGETKKYAVKITSLKNEGITLKASQRFERGFNREVAVTEKASDIGVGPTFYHKALVTRTNTKNQLLVIGGVIVIEEFKTTWDQFLIKREQFIKDTRDEKSKRTGKEHAQNDIDWLVQIMAKLRTLADNNIVHGDAKPANVLVNYTGNYIITKLAISDFGLSRMTKRGNAENENYSAWSSTLSLLHYMNLHRFWKDKKTESVIQNSVTLEEYKLNVGVIVAIHEELLNLGPVPLDSMEIAVDGRDPKNVNHFVIYDAIDKIQKRMPQDWNNVEDNYQYNFDQYTGDNEPPVGQSELAKRRLLYRAGGNENEPYYPVLPTQLVHIFNFNLIDMATFMTTYNRNMWKYTYKANYGTSPTKYQSMPHATIAQIIGGLLSSEEIYSQL